MNNHTQQVINAFHAPALRDVIEGQFDEHRAKKIVLATLPNGPYEFNSAKEYKEVDWRQVAQLFNDMVRLKRNLQERQA
jgi:hypothetical protein